jgi:uncharacterized protein YacL
MCSLLVLFGAIGLFVGLVVTELLIAVIPIHDTAVAFLLGLVCGACGLIGGELFAVWVASRQ